MTQGTCEWVGYSLQSLVLNRSGLSLEKLHSNNWYPSRVVFHLCSHLILGFTVLCSLELFDLKIERRELEDGLQVIYFSR